MTVLPLFVTFAQFLGVLSGFLSVKVTEFRVKVVDSGIILPESDKKTTIISRVAYILAQAVFPA